MNAKEYVSQAYKIDRRINTKLEQIERLRGLTAKVTSTFSDMPQNPGHNQQSMEAAICKIVDLQNEISADIDRLVGVKRDVEAAIKAVPVREQRDLLELRYLCGWTWRAIAVEMGYNSRSVYKIHVAALKNVVVPQIGH